jgi:hypothetical protein
MLEENKEWKEAVAEIEGSIYYNIDMAFSNFKNQNPTLELVCDKKTMSNWYDFIKWMCAHESVEDIEFEEELGLKVSPLISSAHDICVHFYYKYNGDMIEEAKSMLCKCEPCEGEGIVNEGTAEEDTCEDCYGSGTCDDVDPAFDAIDEAKSNIVDSFNIDSFKELYKISI